MTVSVVVPTHNRSALLRRHLRALAAQTYPKDRIEVIIVCDGCRDDSAAVASDGGADQVIETAAVGPASARNAGLAAARNALLLFVDDDIIPDPGWIGALVDDVRPGDATVLHMGYCPHAPEGILTHLDRRNAAWYESKIAPLTRPGYEPCFTDFFSGNFAVNRDAFRSLGGFDDRFRLAEDFEMAFRALQAGWRIRFVPAARATHHTHRDARAYGDQAFHAGKADAQFVRVHPSVAPHVRLGMRRRLPRRIAGLAWRAVALRTTAGIRFVERIARLGERIKARPLLDLLYPLVWDGQYWRGVAAG